MWSPRGDLSPTGNCGNQKLTRQNDPSSPKQAEVERETERTTFLPYKCAIKIKSFCSSLGQGHYVV